MSNSSDADDRLGRVAVGMEFAAVAEFAEAWDSAGGPPQIADYLPDAQTLRLGALVELIRVDLRQRWLRNPLGRRDAEPLPQASAPKRLRDYCAEFPELVPRLIPAGLVYEEFVIRRHSGDRVDPRECLREYPDQAVELRELLNADDEDLSTRRVGPEFTVTSIGEAEATRTTAALTAAPLAPSGDALDRFEIGQRVDDFDLLTGLGSGAFARVFLARQRTLQRLVAVKISADRGTEPQTLAQLDHDYIVRVFDQRLLEDPGIGDPASRRLRLLYMQFLPGGTLLSVLRWVRATPPEQRTGQLLLDAVDAAMEEKGEIRPADSSVRAEISNLSWPETVAWLGRRLAEALCYADAQGVLHRDVKPANVLLTAEAVPKLADFNISFSRSIAGDSPVAYFGGSLAYMSPEQLEACHPERERTAADLDTRSDIYSLGVVLWELLTGAKPFDDTSPSEAGDVTTLSAMLKRRCAGVGRPAIDRIPPDCPAALRRVLLTCLECDRERRWTDGAELAQQFELCLDKRGRDLVDPPPSSWRLRARAWLVPVVVLAIGMPNVIASLFNIQHNRMLIIDRLSIPAQHYFIGLTTIVNGVFFPIGIVVVVYLSRRLFSVPRRLRKGRDVDPAVLAEARSAALLLGDRAVLVCFSLWSLAALTFPITLQVATGEVTASIVVHFLASLLICGAMAVAYPYFLINFYTIRCIYPMFLRHGDIAIDDAAHLRRLGRRCTAFLAMAASVPLLAVAGLTFLSSRDIQSVIPTVRLLCVGAIVAFLIAYVLFRALEADLQALQRVVDPSVAQRGERTSAVPGRR